MSDNLDTKTGWLEREQLENIRANVPLVYVDAVPVRVNEIGVVTEIGLLLRQAADGTISRMVVTGRVLYGERVRDALLRHLEKDLGPVALPRIPPAIAPLGWAKDASAVLLSGSWSAGDPRKRRRCDGRAGQRCLLLHRVRGGGRAPQPEEHRCVGHIGRRYGP